MGNWISERAGMRLLSSARRISDVSPIKGHRACALLFDESPCAMGDATETIIDALRSKDGHATFAVYGSTAENYPDHRGKKGKESGRGVHYAHLPDLEADDQGGAEAHPELVRAILDGGHQIIASGYRMIPADKPLFSRRSVLRTVGEVGDDLRRLTTLCGDPMEAILPPMGGILIRDGFDLYDVCGALGWNCIAPAKTYGMKFYMSDDPRAEAKRLVRSLAKQLRDDPDAFDGMILRFDGGKSPALRAPLMSVAAAAIVEQLTNAGYELITVHELLRRAPFADAEPGDDVFPAARRMTLAGYTVCCRNNCVRPDCTVTREMLYAMMTPRDVMIDYISSRILKTEPVFEQNKLYEKEFLMAPGSPLTAGMYYGYASGWSLEQRHSAMTQATFGKFLDQISAGRDLDWHAPKDGSLTKQDVILALDQLISAEKAGNNGE